MRSYEHRVFVVGRVIALVSGKGFVGFQDSEVDVTCQSIIIFTKQPHSYFLHSLICSFVISRPGGMGKASAVEGLVPSKLLKQHLKACKASLTKCGLCALHNAWKKHKKPWLRAKLVNEEIKLGCAICATDGLPGPWAAFEQEPANILKKSNLERHEKSQLHVMACKGAARSNASAKTGPPKADFEDAMKSMMQGGSSRQGGSASDKKSRIRYALSEAICAHNRKLLSEAHCLALMRDERKGNLLLRFKAVLPDLTIVSGSLGLQALEGSAESIATATAQIMQHFCQPWKCPPRGSAKAEGVVDEDLLHRLKHRVSIIVTDAASAELLASDLHRGVRRAADQTQTLDIAMPNIKIVGRDCAHATTRLLKRPFSKSPTLNSLMQEWIHGSDSFCQKVWHSPLLSKWWAKAIGHGAEELGIDGDCTSLSAAKHRFATFLNPLSRLCKNLQTVFDVCGRVQAMRGEEASWAGKLCRNFSGFKAALLALCADAASICSDFTRYSDREDMDLATLNLHAQGFSDRGRALFVEGQALTLPTYTRELMERSDPITIIVDGFAKEVKVTRQDVDRAMEVLQDRTQWCDCFLLFS